MNYFKVFGIWVVPLLVFLGCNVHMGFAGTNVFITWDDLKVDDSKFFVDLRGAERNRSRIIVVDKNGHGDSVTVNGAIDMVPQHNTQRVKIYVLPGIYKEKVYIPASKPYISLIGNLNQTSETVITWHNKASDKYEHGGELGTYRSASVTVESDYFCASGITFENSVEADPKVRGKQAVALKISGDRAVFYKVRILGKQDTLLDDSHSHYFYQCYIEGTVDFIFGQAKSLYQNCVIHSVAEEFGAIAAHHRDSKDDDTGFSFVNCKIEGTGSVILGRAWGKYSRVVYSYCDLPKIINPKGWSDWGDQSKQQTAEFGEYECRGEGANRSQRVKWAKSLSYNEVRPFLDTKYIGGNQWLSL